MGMHWRLCSWRVAEAEYCREQLIRIAKNPSRDELDGGCCVYEITIGKFAKTHETFVARPNREMFKTRMPRREPLELGSQVHLDVLAHDFLWDSAEGEVMCFPSESLRAESQHNVLFRSARNNNLKLTEAVDVCRKCCDDDRDSCAVSAFI